MWKGLPLRRVFGNKIVIISLVIVLLLVLVTVTAGENSKLSVVRNIITVPLSPLQKVLLQ